MRQLFIRQPLPGMNDIIHQCERSPFAWASTKKKWAQVIALYAREQRFQPISGPADYALEFIEPNRRRDPDNFIAGGCKVIFDALQLAGLLENDGWKHVLSISTSWRVDAKKPGVKVVVVEGAMREAAGKERVA